MSRCNRRSRHRRSDNHSDKSVQQHKVIRKRWSSTAARRTRQSLTLAPVISIASVPLAWQVFCNSKCF